MLVDRGRAEHLLATGKSLRAVPRALGVGLATLAAGRSEILPQIPALPQCSPQQVMADKAEGIALPEIKLTKSNSLRVEVVKTFKEIVARLARTNRTKVVRPPAMRQASASHRRRSRM